MVSSLHACYDGVVTSRICKAVTETAVDWKGRAVNWLDTTNGGRFLKVAAWGFLLGLSAALSAIVISSLIGLTAVGFVSLHTGTGIPLGLASLAGATGLSTCVLSVGRMTEDCYNEYLNHYYNYTLAEKL